MDEFLTTEQEVANSKIILELNNSIGKEQWIFLVTEMFLPTQKFEGCLPLHICSDLCV